MKTKIWHSIYSKVNNKPRMFDYSGAPTPTKKHRRVQTLVDTLNTYLPEGKKAFVCISSGTDRYIEVVLYAMIGCDTEDYHTSDRDGGSCLNKTYNRYKDGEVVFERDGVRWIYKHPEGTIGKCYHGLGGLIADGYRTVEHDIEAYIKKNYDEDYEFQFEYNNDIDNNAYYQSCLGLKKEEV